MPTEPVIRLAEETDAKAISALTRRLTSEHIARDFTAEGRRFLHDALRPEQIAENMRTCCRYFAAELGGEIVGVVATRDDRHLLMLFVDEKVQGRGLARRLWERAKGACMEAGYPGPFTVSAAMGAVPVYEKLGFAATGPATTEHGVTRLPMATRSPDSG